MKAAALIGALTISLCTIFLFSLTLPGANSHHVVFEEIGQMAGALSYIHVVVPVNISGLLNSVADFRSKIIALKTMYADTAILSRRLEEYGGMNVNGPGKHLLLHFRCQLTGLMDLLIKDADVICTTVLSLKSSLPQVHNKNDNREKRSSAGLIVGSTILSGVFGTLMGWFTHIRLTNLQEQINEVKNEQHRLLQIQRVSMARLDALEKVLREVIIEMEKSENTWVNYFALDHARVQLHFYLQKLVRGLQAAHLRRLSVDLLDDKQLQHIFDTAARQANAHNYMVMIEHPSDLFQIETSYLHDRQDVQLILHIPMTPPDAVLRLFQLHPFPLPFTDSHFIMPDPANQIFAISSGVDWFSIEMSVANLMSCHRINSAYLCEHHGVMRRELNSTCLGSLYMQDFVGATDLCEMRIVEQKETVLQLQDNWYLVYSPVAFTSYITCLNNSNSEVFMKTGPNRVFISPSCRMRLKDHLLVSDFALRLDTTIKHYEWDLEEIAFSPEERTLSLRLLQILDSESVGRSTLNSIRQDIAIEKRSSSWIYLFSILGAFAATILAVIISYIIYVHYFVTLKKRVVNIILCTLLESIVNMIRPPQIPVADPVPPLVQQPLLGAAA
jgi:hypothetical protein